MKFGDYVPYNLEISRFFVFFHFSSFNYKVSSWNVQTCRIILINPNNGSKKRKKEKHAQHITTIKHPELFQCVIDAGE